MRIMLQSDLHFEFGTYAWQLPKNIRERADVIVLAGDIHTAPHSVDEVARGITQQHGIEVVIIAGKHEYYGEHLPSSLRKMREASSGDFAGMAGMRERFGYVPRVHFLENDAVTIKGVRFLGCTLWTDFRLYGGEERRGRTDRGRKTTCHCMRGGDDVRGGERDAGERAPPRVDSIRELACASSRGRDGERETG